MPKMSRLRASALISIFLLCVCSHVHTAVDGNLVDPDLVVRNVERHIDLQSQLTKITNRVVLDNNSKDRATQSFLFCLDGVQRKSLSYITARVEPGKLQLKVTETKVEAHRDKAFFSIDLANHLAPRRTLTIEVEMILTHELVPHPKQIAQQEKQLVKYTGNVYAYLPYAVAKQTTFVGLPSRNIESYTKIKPVSQTGSGIVYGPFEKQPPYVHEELTVHFENNNKFLTVTRLERTIEISHWGNIAVEEHIDLLHTGALLKGSFSRYEYARESKSGQASIQSFDTILPAAASDIYYRDEIGNISTSHTRIKKDSVELNLRPRFPLFGGWKTRYTIGYNVPSYEYLFHSGDEYTLEMRLLDHIFDDMVVDEMVLKIILPEGARNMQLELPYPATRLPDSLHYTYLDVTGRPVVSVTKKNLVENHIQSFRFKYTFPRLLMLQEPLLVALALYLLFLLVITYVRWDFSIDKDEASESKLRIAGQCEKILAAQDRRINSYNELDDQLVCLKANKDTNAFLAAVKVINQEYKAATSALNEISQKLKGESGDVYERVQELQRCDRSLKELYNQQQALYVDKLVPGKISRQQFVEAESAIGKKKEECAEKINAIVKSLQ
ncbi:dolichyl-diphosphooligosaccharide--protein glycosyltransferase subunit 1 [Harpegnathos saltator]|uniref:Dolichyl-diphosphooligosaccharide--protein glycosyltransferase subunit 1 n=1 Tax=Harpegnathos saltator TaxID=610380 RepID=E2BYY5_HARSA|nr:dolichyl-diphosphooligosaccharide--protein glycosyltransferase subunit 1 [Harpegnathos saltator]XP_011147590.1 dolichyl-diphosphooligosaccharide--protein glycosyltransferase subunit 1 [Harpegnathos saltator]XP_025154946.1 dolichyl-diphosphooligosaccharide--protein glycosyltransferase subunit 1 [Harpegnathos saltator]XP_025154947.1 dolichyl-diphosphooligosaccharide--protein glycosyltransferase subunit 1 [Harpegnathos saltator]EFN79103.1 Dolichyl-diphosphooligosaccharide--protein glycosyltrans